MFRLDREEKNQTLNIPLWFSENGNAVVEKINALIDNEPEMKFFLSDATRYGRKLRTALSLQMIKWANWDLDENSREDLLDILARIEILHSASCILDDIIDGDKIRRGVPAFYIRNGFNQALLTVQLMVTIAYRDLKQEEIFENMVKTVRDTVIGECYDSFLLAEGQKSASEDTIENYLKKTTPCFEMGHKLAAKFCGRDEKDCNTAAQYGKLIGAFYQMTNDHYDWFCIDARKRGKMDDEVLLTFNIPMAYLIEEKKAYANLLGKRISRSKIAELVKITTDFGIDKKIRKLIDQTKDGILNAFPGDSIPEDIHVLLRQIDSALFWSYSYEKNQNF